MSEQKWQTVGKKGSKPVPARQKGKVPGESSRTSPPLPPALISERHSKPISKHQLTFEKCLKQMDVPAVCSLIRKVQLEYNDNPELLLKEVATIVSSEFSTVQVESDFKFDFLPSLLHADLLKCCLEALSLCPQDVLLQYFKYSLEILLTEVKHHRTSYGTRVVLRLLSYHCEMLYKESAELAAQLLLSCVNRVPEALSLLSAVLPQSHYSPAAVCAWYAVCFPLLLSEGNVPREVLHYVEQYSSNLFRDITASQVTELAYLVTPEELLKAILSKPSSAKSNLQAKKLTDLMMEVLVPSYSEEEAMTCFRLTLCCDQPSSECVQKLLFVLLKLFPSCFRLWAEDFVACHATSCALLNYTRQHIDQVNTIGFPRAHIIQFLSQRHLVSKGEVSALCEELLANIEESNGARKGGAGSTYIYPLVVVLVVCYLVVLGLVLHRLALRGPEEFAWLLSLVTFDRIHPPHVMLLQLLNHAVHPLAQII
ncbi:hypothetical protein EMCRGX_G034160 [Ephydatia muelleri]